MRRKQAMTEEKMKEIMEDCTLCPRECHANRLEGRLGYCMEPAEIFAARAALHFWEEPCISGESGSGTVFFNGCNLRCVYCQNYAISAGQSGYDRADGAPGRGKDEDAEGRQSGQQIGIDRLSQIFLELQEKGAANINLVTPTHYVPQIVLALKKAKENGLNLPVVYNCGGYEKVETLSYLEGCVDIFLPDMKYMRADTSLRYSKAADYPQRAKEAIAEMVRQVGSPVFDEVSGLLKKGVIVRHLALPGHVREAGEIIRYLHETYGEKILLSIMRQYTPLPGVADYPEINRKITKREYESVMDAAISCGVEEGFFQEQDVAEESFIPFFDGEGI